MSANQVTFEFASERLELAVNAVARIAEGRFPLHDLFTMLSVLQSDHERCDAVVTEKLSDLAALSDGPIKWALGRGLSSLVRNRDAAIPQVWSSAHKAALKIAVMVLESFYWPLEGITDADEQQATFRKLLSAGRRKALAMTNEEVADLQERIRRERAKLLREPVKPRAIWRGNGVVAIDGKPVALEPQEATVLQALIELGGAAKRPDLEKRARYKDVAAIMKKLSKRFPDYITCPGGRGRGGYSTTIVDGTKEE